MAECLLQRANGRPDLLCDEEYCLFWRVVDHLGVAEEADWEGCAIQHFALLDGGGELAAWLMTAKQRAELRMIEGDESFAARCRALVPGLQERELAVE